MAAAPDWGDGDPSSTAYGACHVDLPLPCATPPAALRLPALAVTLARYDGHGATAAATVGTDDRGAREYALPASATLRDLAATEPAHTAHGVVAGILEADPGPLGRTAPLPRPALPAHLRLLAPSGRLHPPLLPLPAQPCREQVAEGFTRHLAQVYRQAVLAPDTAVADVELLDRDERDRVARLGKTANPARTPDTLPRAFARVAAATPDAIALCDGGSELSYRELDERSARIAAGLRARGVRSGDRVGVCLERSAELVVTLLGVVRAGRLLRTDRPGLPHRPSRPHRRGRRTARRRDPPRRVPARGRGRTPDPGRTHRARSSRAHPDCRGRAGRTPEDGSAPLPPAERSTTATAPPERAGTAEDGPDGTPAPDDPAYVIYTSGSTGRPKGVTVPHRNVVALIDATRDEYGLGPDDTWTLFHSAAFDFSVWEIWGCLLTGGRLVVVPYVVTRDPDDFRDLLLARRVTVLSQTPSAFSQLLQTDHTGLPVRLVVFGGEPLDSRMLLPWFDRHPETACRTVNMFGITETTVHVTAQTVTRELALMAPAPWAPPCRAGTCTSPTNAAASCPPASPGRSAWAARASPPGTSTGPS